MAVALIFAMKLRHSEIILNDDLEEFMRNIHPPITEDNYGDILRCTERIPNIEDRLPSVDQHKCEPSLIIRVINISLLLLLFVSLISQEDIHHSDSHGWTSLHHAIDHQQINTVRYLLDRKVNINAQTNRGITPLIIACYHGCLEMIELLLTYAARMDIRTNNVH